MDNPVNDVFNLTIEYPVGTIDYPALERVTSYLTLLGTETLGYEAHRAKLQALGGSMEVSANSRRFVVSISGFDNRFEETLALVADLLEHPAGDKAKLSILKQSELTNRIMQKRDLTELDDALVEYLVYGGGSSYLRDKGKLDDETLLSTLKEVQGYEFDVHYSGSLPDEQVASALKKTWTLDRERKEKPFYSVHDIVLKGDSQVFFIPKKKSPQTRIEALILADRMTDLPTRYTSTAAGSYFGGGMGSVLFQEIREFRSMAYSTNAYIIKQNYCAREDSPAYLKAFVGTQGDKTIDAMTVLDSLIRHLPLSGKRLEMTRKNMWSNQVTNYPTFRGISREIATDLREGFSFDPAKEEYALLERLTMDDIDKLWKQQVADRPIVWAVVGDPDKIGLENLSKFGPVTQLKPGDVIK